MHTPRRGQTFVWGCLAAALLANLAGYAWNLFEQIRWFDDVIHIFTTFALTLLLGLWLDEIVLTGARIHPILLI